MVDSGALTVWVADVDSVAAVLRQRWCGRADFERSVNRFFAPPKRWLPGLCLVWM